MSSLTTEIAAWAGEITVLYLIFGSIPTYLIVRWYRKKSKKKKQEIK